jgi:hypothetical protein
MGRASRKRAEQRRRAPSNGVATATRPPEGQDAPPARRNRRVPTRRLPLQARTGLQTLEELCRTRREIEDTIAEQVAALSRLGADWGDIGRALGVTRQAARQRYGGRAP